MLQYWSVRSYVLRERVCNSQERQYCPAGRRAVRCARGRKVAASSWSGHSFIAQHLRPRLCENSEFGSSLETDSRQAGRSVPLSERFLHPVAMPERRSAMLLPQESFHTASALNRRGGRQSDVGCAPHGCFAPTVLRRTLDLTNLQLGTIQYVLQLAQPRVAPSCPCLRADG